MTGPTELEKRLERRVRDWRKQSAAYRLAQHDCEPSEEEWELNKGSAEMLERCASELASDLSAGRVFRRSQYAPVELPPAAGGAGHDELPKGATGGPLPPR
jgi:hypothetical protein